MVMWLLAWIDRGNIGFAKLQMATDLHFDDAIYGLAAGIFFIGYLIFEVPSNLLLQKIGARKTLVRICIGWGIVCILMMFVSSSTMFYVLRFLLGSFEAGFNPGVLFFLTLWFPTSRRAKAFALFSCAVNLSGVIGGPMAGTLMARFSGAAGLAGWQWVFLIEGALTVIAGVVAFFYVTDRMEDAKWLTEEERRAVSEDLARDRAALGPRQSSLGAALRDGRTWLLTAIYFCCIMANAALFYWGPTILRDAGFKSFETIGWIFSGISLCGVVAMIANAAHSDRRHEVRFHAAVPLLVCVVAMVLLGFVPNQPMLVVATYGVALVAITTTIPVFWQTPNFILAGTGAAVSIAIINSFGNLGGFVAPYAMGLLKQMTGEVSIALWAVAAVNVIAAVVIIMYVPTEKASERGPATA
jgi:MFS family permease